MEINVLPKKAVVQKSAPIKNVISNNRLIKVLAGEPHTDEFKDALKKTKLMTQPENIPFIPAGADFGICDLYTNYYVQMYKDGQLLTEEAMNLNPRIANSELDGIIRNYGSALLSERK